MSAAASHDTAMEISSIGGARPFVRLLHALIGPKFLPERSEGNGWSGRAHSQMPLFILALS